jgi:hypothetical protein
MGDLFAVLKRKFVYSNERKRFRETVCAELRQLNVSAFACLEKSPQTIAVTTPHPINAGPKSY